MGYQPVGMNPSGVLAPGSLTLITARLLVLALATSRTDSSGVSARELGVEPAGALGSMAVLIVSTALPAEGVDDRDGVAVGVGDIEDLASLRQEQLVGVLLRGDRGGQLAPWCRSRPPRPGSRG